MEWATATAGDVDAGTEEQLCLLPIGCLEPHGRHLPTGNDALIAHRWALMVAECEPVVVLPPLYYAYVKPGRHLPGTVSLDTTVLLSLLENICDEVARNGYRKILLLNCHGGNDPDPHTWLDPKRVMIQAETIARALVEIDPAGEKGYRTNLASFQRELHILDRRIAEVFAPLEGARFMVYHPAYGYFADAYGLRQVAVETEGKEPSARQLTALIEAARASEVEIIFYQPQFSSKYATVVADAVGAVAVPLDPLARNYIRNLEEMADKIKLALDRKAH